MSQKREQIIQTGEALFIKHGMSRVTVEEICRKLKVTRDNFYSILSRSRSLLLLCLKKGTFER